jgi:hypothetical protein
MRPAVLILGLAGALVVLSDVSPVSAQVPGADVIRFSTSPAATDHRALAAHYRAHAIEHDADATRHDTLAAEAKARATDDDSWDLARDAAHYAQHSREAAEALRDLAHVHEAIADRLEGGKAIEVAPASMGCCGTGMAKERAKTQPDAPAPKHDHAGR